MALVGLTLAACGGGSTSRAPATPTDVTATPGPGYITVSWTDNSDNETGFEVFRASTAEMAALQAGSSVGTVGPDVTTFVDMDVELEQEYRYSVVARGADGDSHAAAAAAGASVPVGVDLMVGTNNRRFKDANGTVFVAYLMLPEELLTDNSLTFEIQLTGPPGWNGDDPLRFNCRSEDCLLWRGFTWGSVNSITALAGEYTLTVTVDGEEYRATATLADPTFKFDRPTNITVTSATNDAVTGTWTLPSGTGAVYLALHEGASDRAFAWTTRGVVEEHTFTGPTFVDGVYSLEVAPVNSDVVNYPLKVEPFGLSYDRASFVIGDVMAAECASADEVVTIPDAALLQAVRESLGRPTGDLTCAHMALLVRLHAHDSGITSLEGLQYAVNLADVSLHGNEVSDLTPLAGLTDIFHLNVNVNEVTDVEPLRDLVNLFDLHLCCATGNVTDVTPLEGLTNLVWLNISTHELGNDVVWQLLENYPALRGMWIGDNGLTDFAPLANWPELEVMQAFNSTIPDLAPIAALTQLHTLEIGWSTIGDPTPIYGMTQLRQLHLDDLGLLDIAFLEEFDQLETLSIAQNQITTLAPLVANPGIGAGDYVDVRANALDLADPDVLADIQALLDRGVDLEYE